MFARILVPFDGSAGAEQALRKSCELAKLTGGEILILTVYRHQAMLEASFSMVRVQDPGSLDDVLRNHAREVAEHAKKLAAEAGVERVRAFVKVGQPARTIVGFAREHNADLIVIGSRGLGSMERYLLGSVSHKVTGLAECPVLVV